MSSDDLITFEVVPGDFRRNAGVVLIAPDGRVFAGQRSDTVVPAWQMPQGGIDGDEDVTTAALRELTEETGVPPACVEVLAATPMWLAYAFPEPVARKRWRGRYRGQAQKWVAMRFKGSEADINLEQAHPEFSHWAWMHAHDLAALVVPFKRPVYRRVFALFAPHLAGAA